MGTDGHQIQFNINMAWHYATLVDVSLQRGLVISISNNVGYT